MTFDIVDSTKKNFYGNFMKKKTAMKENFLNEQNVEFRKFWNDPS